MDLLLWALRAVNSFLVHTLSSRAGFYFLCLPKESKQRKGTLIPKAWRSTGRGNVASATLSHRTISLRLPFLRYGIRGDCDDDFDGSGFGLVDLLLWALRAVNSFLVHTLSSRAGRPFL